MESLYKVGDTVTIKQISPEDWVDYRFGFNDEMAECLGKTFEIESVYQSGTPSREIPDDGYYYKLKGLRWAWASSMFEDRSKKSVKSKTKKSKIKISFYKKKKIKFNFSL